LQVRQSLLLLKFSTSSGTLLGSEREMSELLLEEPAEQESVLPSFVPADFTGLLPFRIGEFALDLCVLKPGFGKQILELAETRGGK